MLLKIEHAHIQGHRCVSVPALQGTGACKLSTYTLGYIYIYMHACLHIIVLMNNEQDMLHVHDTGTSHLHCLTGHTWSENVNRFLRRVDNIQVHIERVVRGEERCDGALLSTLCRLESAAVIRSLMVIAASVGSC